MIPGEQYDKGRAITWRAEGVYQAAVMFDDLAANRQPDACPLVVVAPMQPLKGLEDVLGVLLIKADAIVRDGQLDLNAAIWRLALIGLDADVRRLLW